MQDERKTSRSQEISVNSLNEELSSSDRTGRHVETEEIQAIWRELESQCWAYSWLNRATCYWHSCSTRRPSSTSWDQDARHRQWVPSRKNWGRHGLQNSRITTSRCETTRKVPAFENWFRKLRTTQIDLLFNRIYDRINHLILCPESTQMIRDVVNIELCELLETEPRTQCKVCLSYWNIGIVYWTCGHFLRKGSGENQKFIKCTMDLSIPEYVIKKGRPHGQRYGKKPGDREYYTANQLKKKCKKKFFQGIHDRFIRDETCRNRMVEHGRDEDVCRQWDALADEDHTHHLTPQEYHHYKSNWWLTSNKTGSNTVPVEHRPDFKQALSTLQQLKQKEGAQRNQQWAQRSSSSSWWSWRFLVDSLFLWKSPWRWTKYW